MATQSTNRAVDMLFGIISSKHTKDKADKKLKREREEMWERLGMNWEENSCLPKTSERASFRFLTQLVVK